MRVRLQKACILQTGASVLVTSSNNLLCGNLLANYWRHAGRVNVDGAVRDLGGTKLAKACEAIAPLDIGQIGVTPSFFGDGVRTSSIIHANCPDGEYGPAQPREAQYRDMMGNILQAADSNGNKTLAIPALGCGVMGWHPAIAARISFAAISAFEAQSLEEVLFALIETRVHSAFVAAGRKEWGQPAATSGSEFIWHLA